MDNEEQKISFKIRSFDGCVLTEKDSPTEMEWPEDELEDAKDRAKRESQLLPQGIMAPLQVCKYVDGVRTDVVANYYEGMEVELRTTTDLKEMGISENEKPRKADLVPVITFRRIPSKLRLPEQHEVGGGYKSSGECVVWMEQESGPEGPFVAVLFTNLRGETVWGNGEPICTVDESTHWFPLPTEILQEGEDLGMVEMLKRVIKDSEAFIAG